MSHENSSLKGCGHQVCLSAVIHYQHGVLMPACMLLRLLVARVPFAVAQDISCTNGAQGDVGTSLCFR